MEQSISFLLMDLIKYKISQSRVTYFSKIKINYFLITKGAANEISKIATVLYDMYI